VKLEDAIAEALHAKADAVPHTPMPRLGRAPRRRLVPVAVAATAAVAIGAVAFLSVPRDHAARPATDPTTATTMTPPNEPMRGEVYYSVRLTDLGAGGVIRETQLWQPKERTGEWRQKVVDGLSIRDGRVVPGPGRVSARPGGECYPAFSRAEEPCTSPASWFSPIPEFLAGAPRDVPTIAAQLHEEAVAVSEELAPVVELKMVGVLLSGNGVPEDLVDPLRQVVAGLPGVQVVEGMADPTGATGTGYRLPYPGGTVAVIFASDGHYLGTPSEAVRHGIAPGLGKPPSRMLG
jgi:hypothetical protein